MITWSNMHHQRFFVPLTLLPCKISCGTDKVSFITSCLVESSAVSSSFRNLIKRFLSTINVVSLKFLVNARVAQSFRVIAFQTNLYGCFHAKLPSKFSSRRQHGKKIQFFIWQTNQRKFTSIDEWAILFFLKICFVLKML